MLAITNQTEDNDNYIVSFKDPDGREVSIMIPKYGSGYGDYMWDTDSPIGLNLVFGGHYE